MDSKKNPIKVLLVEDLECIRQAIKNLLKKTSLIDIVEADNGFSAMQELIKGDFDLIISDWVMPRMTGLDLLKTVRHSEKLKDIPFLMITAESEPKDRDKAFKAGATGFIAKPFKESTIFEYIDKVLT